MQFALDAVLFAAADKLESEQFATTDDMSGEEEENYAGLPEVEVGPGGYYLPRHQTHFEPSSHELHGMAFYDDAKCMCQAVGGRHVVDMNVEPASLELHGIL